MASPLFAILESINQTLESGSPGEIRTLVGGSKARYACPLHHRASFFANISQLTLFLLIDIRLKLSYLWIDIHQSHSSRLQHIQVILATRPFRI